MDWTGTGTRFLVGGAIGALLGVGLWLATGWSPGPCIAICAFVAGCLAVLFRDARQIVEKFKMLAPDRSDHADFRLNHSNQRRELTRMIRP